MMRKRIGVDPASNKIYWGVHRVMGFAQDSLVDIAYREAKREYKQSPMGEIWSEGKKSVIVDVTIMLRHNSSSNPFFDRMDKADMEGPLRVVHERHGVIFTGILGITFSPGWKMGVRMDDVKWMMSGGGVIIQTGDEASEYIIS